MSNIGNFGLPNPAQPLGTYQDDKGNTRMVRIADIWFTLLVRLSQLNAERAIMAITPGPSPWTYVATTIGHLYLRGGNISAMTLTRGDDTVTLNPTVGFVPMAAGDIVTVTYSVAPTANFVPGARA